MLWIMPVAQLLLGGLLLAMTSLSVLAQVNVHPDNRDHNNIAEQLISAFYSWDATKLRNLMTEDADTVAILYCQGWAEAANYKVKTRGSCTVTDDISVPPWGMRQPTCSE